MHLFIEIKVPFTENDPAHWSRVLTHTLTQTHLHTEVYQLN